MQDINHQRMKRTELKQKGEWIPPRPETVGGPNNQIGSPAASERRVSLGGLFANVTTGESATGNLCISPNLTTKIQK